MLASDENGQLELRFLKNRSQGSHAANSEWREQIIGLQREAG